MGRLSKEQKKKLDDIVENKGLFKKVNDLLKKHGGVDLQLAALTVQPKNEDHLEDLNLLAVIPLAAGPLNNGNGHPNFNVFPPICEHGKPMVERCTIGGSCRWVCNH